METYTEKASHAEMRFAGHYLNLTGICLLVAGALSYLKVSGVSQRATESGWLQCTVGALLGLFLHWAGERAYRRGLSAYAQPMLASGNSLLLLTLGAAYSYFQLVPAWAMVVGTFGLVLRAGVAAVTYRSPWLAGWLLIALYAGPLAMKFSVDQLGLLVAYLLAIHLATTVMAYRHRWDVFLIGSFGGTYALFFQQFRLTYPATTLAFLVVIYGLFLLSGTGFALLRRGSSDVSAWLSSVNPLFFAFVSYAVLVGLPNAVAISVYGGIAATHLLLATASQRRGYSKMAQSNLALGLLFGQASFSFLTYCSDNTSFFAIVTAGWLLQGFVLLGLSRYLGEDLGSLCRRASYAAIGLAGAQLLYVVPTMAEQVWIEFPAALSLLAYFVYHEHPENGYEQRFFANLVVLLAVYTGGQCLLVEAAGPWGLLACSALAPVWMKASQRYPVTLFYHRWAALLVGVYATLLGLCQADGWLLPAGLFLALLTPLSRRHSEAPLGVMLAAVLWVRASLLLWGASTWWALLLIALISRALFQLSRYLPSLRRPALALEVAVAVSALFLPIEWLPMVVLIGVVPRSRVGLLLAMKCAVAIDSGVGSSLIWCVVGLGVLRHDLQTGALLLGCAFFKSVALDADFVYASGGLELAGMRSLDLWHLVQQAGLVAVFFVAARRFRDEPEWRNVFTLFGLLALVFESSRILYDVYGLLEIFQVILSAFWAAASLLFVGYGTYYENRLSRLFGLVLLTSCVTKMYAVDIWVLNAYDQSTTTLVMGFLLMLVSFLYQFNRERLGHSAAEPQPGRRSLAYDL